MQPLIRLVVSIATVIAVCFALVQTTGRVLFWQLPRFEEAINLLLASSGVAVEGLRGGWRGLNPSVSANQVWFPAGRMTGFDFELDMLESLARNRVVARRMTVVDSHLNVEKTADGWRLRGHRGSGFDARALFAYSDQVWLRGRLTFRDGMQTGTLHVEAMLVNRDHMHRFDIHVQSEPGCDDCALVVSGDLLDGGGGAIRASASRFSLGKELHAMLTENLSPLSPLRQMRFEIAVEGDWRRAADGDEEARLNVKVATRQSPGSAGSITASLDAWRQADGDYRGNGSLTLAGGENTYRIAGGGFWLRDLFAETLSVDVWLPRFSLAELVAPIIETIGTEHRAGNWLAKIAPRGKIDALRLRFDADGLALALRGTGGALNAHRGVPQMDNVAFEASGHARALRVELESHDFNLALPDIFPARGRHDRGGGTLFATFSPGYIGLRAPKLQLAKGSTQGEFSFALARPDDRDEVRAVLEGRVDRIDWHGARDYLPIRLAPGLRRWLLDAIHAGEFHNVRLVYRGHARTRGQQPVRRLEMAANVLGGAVDYHADWPAASDVNGALEITANETRLHGTAQAFGTELAEVRLRVPHRLARAHLSLAGATTVARVFDFVWATPVHDSLPFLSKAWHGTGNVDFAADVTVPFGERDDETTRLQRDDVRLHLHFQDATFDFADLGLSFNAMDESVSYRFPATLTGDALQGTLFDHPVSIAIASDDDSMRFNFAGTATVADAHRLLDIEDTKLAAGTFDFDAAFTIFPASDRAMELEIKSTLAGTEILLPAPLGKSAAEERQTTVALQFLEPHVAASASYGDSGGWLQINDMGIRAGAIGIGVAAPTVDAERGRVVFSGHVATIDVSDMVELANDATLDYSPFAWELRQLRIGTLALESVQFADLLVDGYSADGDIELAIEPARAASGAPSIAGRLAKRGDAPWQIQLTDLTVLESENVDPLAPAMIDRLLAADVVLEKVVVGGEDYGSWRFSMTPANDGVAFANVVADVRGLHIESDGEAFWSKSNESRFAGSAHAKDLKDVLPLWDFAPSVESESFQAVGDLRWPGSPLNFDLHHLSGTAQLDLADGRFLDIAPGGTRILSLVNFSAIVKRMSLDFSDVFGEGVSFDRVLADLAVDDGLARFVAPAKIVGTGSSFRLAGTVDLDSGALDNDMIVTLPFLNSNLPWYAAFLALSNPAGAAGVLLGRQVLKDQINRLSSGRYRISGTYEAPEVEFIGIFANDLDIVPPESVADEPATLEKAPQ